MKKLTKAGSSWAPRAWGNVWRLFCLMSLVRFGYPSIRNTLKTRYTRQLVIPRHIRGFQGEAEVKYADKLKRKAQE